MCQWSKSRNHKTSEKFCTKVTVDIWKLASMQYRFDKMTLRITCIKNFKFKIIRGQVASMYRLLTLQPKSKLGRTKPSTGLHAAQEPRFGHSCTKS